MPSSSFSKSSGPVPTRGKRIVEDKPSDEDEDEAWGANIAEEEDWETDTSQPQPSTEATVLSHAERRRQKQKQKRQLASASESPRKKRKLDNGSASHADSRTAAQATTASKAKTAGIVPAADDPRRQKRQNSVWVGNLSFRTTQDALRTFFDGVGTITRIYMPTRRGNQAQTENMGFAYVDFGSSDAKVIAIALSEGQLDGRNLLIKDGDDFAGRPAKAKVELSGGVDGGEGEKAVKDKGLSKTAQKILRLQKQPPAPTLFLGNLGFETTEESIRELFEAHRYWRQSDKGKGSEKAADEGEHEGGDKATLKDVWIRKIRMGTFEDSGACKGFAFVDFTSIEHATKALINPRNHRLNGRDLAVEYASPDAVRRGGGVPRHPKRDRDSKGKRGSRKEPQKNDPTSAPYTKQRQPQQGDGMEAVEIPEEATKTPRSQKPGRARHDRIHSRRVKPGAALAHAQRQSAAIVPGQGQKTVF